MKHTGVLAAGSVLAGALMQLLMGSTNLRIVRWNAQNARYRVAVPGVIAVRGVRRCDSDGMGVPKILVGWPAAA